MKREALQKLYDEMLIKTMADFPVKKEDMVFGQGCPDAKIMLVGEAPGAEEIRLKKPFVGKAGENLNVFLKAVGLEREQIYITNVVKFRPFVESANCRRRNRTPSVREQMHQAVFLLREIELIKPEIVVTLGNIALRAVSCDKKAVVGALHGRNMQMTHGAHAFCLFSLYHPASIIYNQSLKEVYAADLKALGALAGAMAQTRL